MKNADTLRLCLAAAVLVATACKSETPATTDTSAAAAATAPPATAEVSPPTTTTTPASTSGMMDPNSASQAELAALPGMNDSLAAAVVAGRPYSSMVAVNKALGTKLTKAQRDAIYAKLWTPIDLNKATDQEILMIPGIGPRMLHEFKEYRPYTAMDTFRREIGKYVDKDEVARLEKYVRI